MANVSLTLELEGREMRLLRNLRNCAVLVVLVALMAAAWALGVEDGENEDWY
jgi:hypothetical protein